MLDNNPYNSNNHSFDSSYIITDPFAISTLSLAYLSWIIALAGSISTAVNESFPRFTWWGLAFEITLIILLTLFYCFNLIDNYRKFLSSAFAIAFVYSTNSTNNLVYGDGSTLAAASAGVILLSMINIIWVFYFGSDNFSPINQWIDSYSLRRQNLALITNNNMDNMNNQSLLMKNTNLNPNMSNLQNNYNSNTFSNNNNIQSPYSNNNNNDYNNDLGLNQRYADFSNDFHDLTRGNSMRSHRQSAISPLNGFEKTTSPTTLSPKLINETRNSLNILGANNLNNMENNLDSTIDNFNEKLNNNNNNNNNSNSKLNLHKNNDSVDGITNTVVNGDNAEEEETYPYRAVALYNYDANPDDVNEISFKKGEILQVNDIQGRWWQAKRENGNVGICPSNYVELIN